MSSSVSSYYKKQLLKSYQLQTVFFCKQSVSVFLNNVCYEVVMVRGVVRWHVSVPSAAVAWAVEGSPPSPPIGSPAWPMPPSYWSSHRLTLPLFRGNLASQDSRGIRRGSELNQDCFCQLSSHSKLGSSLAGQHLWMSGNCLEAGTRLAQVFVSFPPIFRADRPASSSALNRSRIFRVMRTDTSARGDLYFLYQNK